MVNYKNEPKKHYTLTEKTGLSANETKIKNILLNLSTWFCQNLDTKTCLLKPRIKRRDLIEKINQALIEVTNKPIDKRVTLKFLDYLLGKRFIAHNPTSDITPNGHIKPSNDTRYFLNPKMINQEFELLAVKQAEFKNQKGKSACHTIDSFLSEENHSCSENQKANMSNSKVSQTLQKSK